MALHNVQGPLGLIAATIAGMGFTPVKGTEDGVCLLISSQSDHLLEKF